MSSVGQDLLISQLPAAGTLTGSEIIPIDVAGVTKRTTVSQIAGIAPGYSGGNFQVNGNLVVTGTTSLQSTENVIGNFSVNTDKFTVAAATGNAVGAGTLKSTGDLTVGSNKFTVAAATGNTVVGGTLEVAGLTTLTGDLAVNGGDIDSTASTFNLLATPAQINIGEDATGIKLGNDGGVIVTVSGVLAVTGALLPRSVTDAGPMTATPGTKKEVVYNLSNDKLYVCTVTHGTAATWSALN